MTISYAQYASYAQQASYAEQASPADNRPRLSEESYEALVAFTPVHGTTIAALLEAIGGRLRIPEEERPRVVETPAGRRATDCG